MTGAGDTTIMVVTTPPLAALAAAARRGLSFLSPRPGVTRYTPATRAISGCRSVDDVEGVAQRLVEFSLLGLREGGEAGC